MQTGEAHWGIEQIGDGKKTEQRIRGEREVVLVEN
jgi:hypothetical protein